MSHNNAPILIIADSLHVSNNQNPDFASQLLKQKPPASLKHGASSKSILNRIKKSKQNDKSEPVIRNHGINSYSNVSLISLEKKLNDESSLDNMSNTSRSLFSTDSPRDIRTIPSLKQNSYYLRGANHHDAYRANPKSSYAAKSIHPSITLDESNPNIQRNEGSIVVEDKPKNAVKSLNFIQSKRTSTIGNKFYHGFKKTSVSQALIEQAESFDLPKLLSPQHKDLKSQVTENFEKEKQAEDIVHVPRPPSKGLLNKARALAAPVLDHRRPKKAGTEVSSIAAKTNPELDSKAYQSLPIRNNVPQSMTNLANQDSTLENVHFETEPDLVSKHKILKPDVERKAMKRTSFNGKASKENDLSSQTDLSHSQNFHHNVKIPLKPLSNNVNGVERPLKRVLNSKAPNSELRSSSKDDLMRRFNEIVTYQTQPVQTGNSQILQVKKQNEGRSVANVKDKENSIRRPVKQQQQQQDENKPVDGGVQKGKKPEEISMIDAKIMLLRNKIKDKEYRRKTRKNKNLEEGEGAVNGIPLKSKLSEHLENKAEMEEEMKKKLLVMRKIQLYDILIKQKMGKKLPKEALRLVKAEFDKVNLELDELKLHEQ